MPLDNDTRGWIMSAISGIACITGASVICVDIIIRRFPGQKNFQIQNSNVFLSCSLSLSFGVMIFSSLYSMLPSAKTYLHKSGLSDKAAAWITIGCFMAGVVGIQLISRFLHHYIPHKTVDCDHTHDEEEGDEVEDCDDHQKIPDRMRDPVFRKHYSRSMGSESGISTPRDSEQLHSDHSQNGNGPHAREGVQRRPSLHQLVSGLVTGSKRLCDEHGQCFGYSDPCGQDCFKIVQSRGGTRAHNPLTRPSGIRSLTTTSVLQGERQPLLQSVAEGAPLTKANSTDGNHSTYTSTNGTAPSEGNSHAHPVLHKHRSNDTMSSHSDTSHSHSHSHSHAQKHSPHPHHHHVPTNAFLSIGLQTSIAIALHKLPEGFITYATNHANPSLGAAVFLALFIHNISEGFTMALPLYLAIGSRWKAMFWSSLLGGASQPLGAGVAALWIHFSGGGKGDGPDERVYGCMFAVTSGIMASVAVQLLSESLDLTHNKNACFVFAFVGMAVLGISSALTA